MKAEETFLFRTGRNQHRNWRKVLLFGAITHGLLFAQGATQNPAPGQTQTPTTQSPTTQTTPPPPATSPSNNTAPAMNTTPPTPPQRAGLNVIVLDPAHGGTDPGARGTGGIRESEMVLEFAAQVRRALESQGFQVLTTRQGNDNPSFDDRSTLANAQRGAAFITLHISSTGLPGTARVYVMNDFPPSSREISGMIPWDRAQAPFLALSKRLGDLVQGQLAQRFRGSPGTAQAAAVRQLRTTAAPAIAVEISSVSVEDRTQIDQMIPGVADAIARGVTAFAPSYVSASTPGAQP